jgi:penicillin amidase
MSVARPRRLAVTLLSVAALTVGAASAPAWSASARSENADQGVTIKRDTYGIPHVYANTTRGIFRGFGYAVAQDRLFQMEMSRRTTQGTVAEVMGAAYLALDKDTRNGADPAAIQAQIAALLQEDRDILRRLCRGDEPLARCRRGQRLRPSCPSSSSTTASRRAGGRHTTSPWSGSGTMANRYSDSSSEIPNYQVLGTHRCQGRGPEGTRAVRPAGLARRPAGPDDGPAGRAIGKAGPRAPAKRPAVGADHAGSA